MQVQQTFSRTHIFAFWGYPRPHRINPFKVFDTRGPATRSRTYRPHPASSPVIGTEVHISSSPIFPLFFHPSSFFCLYCRLYFTLLSVSPLILVSASAVLVPSPVPCRPFSALYIALTLCVCLLLSSLPVFLVACRSFSRFSVELSVWLSRLPKRKAIYVASRASCIFVCARSNVSLCERETKKRRHRQCIAIYLVVSSPPSLMFDRHRRCSSSRFLLNNSVGLRWFPEIAQPSQ